MEGSGGRRADHRAGVHGFGGHRLDGAAVAFVLGQAGDEQVDPRRHDSGHRTVRIEGATQESGDPGGRRVDDDGCEIRFDGLLDIDSRRFPKQLTVNHAGRPFAKFPIDKATFQPGQKKELPKKEEKNEEPKEGKKDDDAK